MPLRLFSQHHWITARPIRSLVSILAILAIALYSLSSVSFEKPPVNVLPASPLKAEEQASPAKIAELCKNHGYSPFRTRSWKQAKPRKVYDLFLLSTELDWLEVRLHTLAEHVDYFVIVEAPTTFTGLPKPLYLEDAWENFTDFHDQIIHRVVKDPGPSLGLRVWDHEDFMRNSLIDGVFPSLSGTPQEAANDDVLIISDVDEIPKPATLQILRHCNFPQRLTLRSQFYYYSFQWLHRGLQWEHPQATTFQGSSTIPPQSLRIGDGGWGIWPFYLLVRWWQKGELWGAAWHCSSCFATLREMRAKMESFSHTSYNTAENRDPRTIVERVRQGLDLFGREEEFYDRVEGNRDVPDYLLQHGGEYGYMLNRDGEDAGFLDIGDFKNG